MAQWSSTAVAMPDGGRGTSSDPTDYTGFGNGGGGGPGGGRVHPYTWGDQPLLGSSASARVRRAAPADIARNPRRGLLLTSEQLAGPPAPSYLMRRAYVYGRQNLL